MSFEPLGISIFLPVTWILRENGSGTRDVLNHLLFASLPGYRIEMELGNSEAIKHAVMYEMGISCLSRRVIQDQQEFCECKSDNYNKKTRRYN